MVRRRPSPLILRYRGVILPAIGPCVILAPVVFVVAIVGMLCWPFVVFAAVALWGFSWIVERVFMALGVSGAAGLFARTTRVMRLVAKPWTYYDAPGTPAADDTIAAPKRDATSNAPDPSDPR